MYTMLDVRATTQSPLICSSVVKTHEWNVFQRKIFYGYFAIGKAFIIWLNKNIDCWWWSGPACTTRTWPTSRCTRPTRTFWTSSQGHTHMHTLLPFYQCCLICLFLFLDDCTHRKARGVLGRTFQYKLIINANPWISEVSGVGWGILFYMDFAWSLKKRSKELLLHCLLFKINVTKYK